MGILFKDRFDVGQLLAKRLLKYKDVDGVVLAIPRGGVPIAYEVANYLELPLYIILSVGQFYENFSQVSDEEVIRFLNDVSKKEENKANSYYTKNITSFND